MKARDYAAALLLTPSERDEYGATVTARSMETGQMRTFARTNETTLNAIRLIADELDLLAGDWRIITISTPVTIHRDIFASRVKLVGIHSGSVGRTPEALLLGTIKRKDLLPPAPEWRIAGSVGPGAAA